MNTKLFITLLLGSIVFNSYAIDKSLLPQNITDPFFTPRVAESSSADTGSIIPGEQIRLAGIVTRLSDLDQTYQPSMVSPSFLTNYYFDPKDETIESIALKFSVPETLLKQVNGIDKNNLKRSQILMIPGGIFSQIDVIKPLSRNINTTELKEKYFLSESELNELHKALVVPSDMTIYSDLGEPVANSSNVNLSSISGQTGLTIKVILESNPELLALPLNTSELEIQKKGSLVLDANKKITYLLSDNETIGQASEKFGVDISLFSQVGPGLYEFDYDNYIFYLQGKYLNDYFYALIDIKPSLASARHLTNRLRRNMQLEATPNQSNWNIGYTGVNQEASPYYKVEFGPFSNIKGAEKMCETLEKMVGSCIVISEFYENKINSTSNFINSVLVLNQGGRYVSVGDRSSDYSGVRVESVDKLSADVVIDGKSTKLKLKHGSLPMNAINSKSKGDPMTEINFNPESSQSKTGSPLIDQLTEAKSKIDAQGER